MTFVATVRPASLAVRAAIQFGSRPFRLMAVRVRFPDIGSPVTEQAGFLRYGGEPVTGDTEPGATGSASDHHF